MRFVHSADWQLGKPFGRVRDPQKRALLLQERIEVMKRIGGVAQESGADFVLVAGDVFDSRSADKATVSAACSAVGRMGVPVIVIPGNHDHAGPGGIWEQEFFLREQRELAPNLTVLLSATPVDLGTAVVLPCPVAYRSMAADPTEWLRSTAPYACLPADKPRIILAHGSIQAFTGQWGDEDELGGPADIIDLDRLPHSEIDYVALGDWHGTLQVQPQAWYAGTPELDRFPRGADQDPGNVLVVEVERGKPPSVSKHRTARIGWHELRFDISQDGSLEMLNAALGAILGGRAHEDLLLLELTGSVGIETADALDQMLDSLEARLLRLKYRDHTTPAPLDEEVQALVQATADPLVARVAAELVRRTAVDGEEGVVARIALRELHRVWKQGVTR